MGDILFRVRQQGLLTEEGTERADFLTFDGRVICSQVSWPEDDILCFRRDSSESSRLRLLCCLPNGNRYVLQTGSLRERPEPYDLEAELARGELSRLRNQYGAWIQAGLMSSDAVRNSISVAHEELRRAVMGDGDSEAALKSLAATHAAIELLGDQYTAQRLAFRRQRSRNFPLFLGCRLAETPNRPDLYLESFNAARLSAAWSRLVPSDGEYNWDELDQLVDWAADNRINIICGPLLDLTPSGLPDWVRRWESDPRNLQSVISDHVETVVSRYVGRIRHWEIVYGGNCGIDSPLTEEQRLNLIARAVQVANAVDEQIQSSLTIIQPWGEYLSAGCSRLPALQTIDTLRRSGVRITEVNVDLTFGSGANDSQPRDLLQLSFLLDQWSVLQVPLNIITRLPSASAVGEERRAIQLQQLVRMALAKERIRGIYISDWTEETEARSCARADGFLLGNDGDTDLALDLLRTIEDSW